jgi:Tfp pilus assembly protein PilX
MGTGTFPDPLRIRQGGASLVVTLIMLVVLMLMGVSAIVVSNTQFRMAANLQFQNLAMANADSALAQAESWIGKNFSNPGFATRSDGGLYPVGTAPDPNTMAWTDTTSVKVDILGNQRYTIELLAGPRTLPSNSIGNCNVYGQIAPCPKVNVYRLTGRGTSVLGAVKIVQSIYAVRTNV